MHAQADAAEGLGCSQGGKHSQRVQALYRVYLVQCPYIELFCVKPVEKTCTLRKQRQRYPDIDTQTEQWSFFKAENI